MAEIVKPQFPCTTKMGASRNEADVAIAWVDNGHFDARGMYTLATYGYSDSKIPNTTLLQDRSFILHADDKKPVLCIELPEKGDLLKLDLDSIGMAIAANASLLNSKKVWMPLILNEFSDKEESIDMYNLTIRALNRISNILISNDVQFIIHVDDTVVGSVLMDAIQSEIVAPAEGIEQILRKQKCDFYLVGSNWGNDGDQRERFYRDGIWETGYDEKYARIINDVEVGDVLILKSAFQARGISYLRVKAVGRVTANPNDGVSLEMHWFVVEIQVDIEDLGYYRYTIAPAEFKDLVVIFSAIDISLWHPMFVQKPSKTVPIASLLSDSDQGADYLNISKDVTAFARVMAAKSFKPPLAIALFGKWGSGKSFFMNSLHSTIEDLSAKNTHQVYCEGIAHIRFNAWSYLDANLWASMVTRIFEGLNQYITNNTAGDGARIAIEKQLTQQLTITKDEITILSNQKSSVEGQIKNLEAKKELLSVELTSKIRQIENNTIVNVISEVDDTFKVREKVLDALENNPTYQESADEFKKVVPQKYWDDPQAAYQEAKSTHAFLKVFFRRENRTVNLMWLCAVLGGVILVPYLVNVLIEYIWGVDFSIPQVLMSFFIMLGTIWKRVEETFKRLHPILASFWKIKQDYELEKQKAIANFEQHEKALKLEIEKGKAEIVGINHQIQLAESLKTDIEFKISNALATEALYSFIERRCNSEDYKKHLGIISIIRKDFEILNDLFTDHNTEASKKEDAEKFKKYFTKPLERIILYIDDLDRCPEENVVEVLEAVNLLMAFPLFIVVVGVDPRWVKNALLKKYYLQFSGRFNLKDKRESREFGDLEMIEPSDYLEKIFQIPFHVKEADDPSVKNMIKQIAETTAVLPKKQDIPKSGVEIDDYVELPSVELQPPSATRSIESNFPVDGAPESLVLSETEVLFMQELSGVIGNNPRAIKRFINVYRIIKAHEDFSSVIDNRESTILVIMFLLALPIGKHKLLNPAFLRFICNVDFINSPLSDYLTLKFNDPKTSRYLYDLINALSVGANLKLLKRQPAGSFFEHYEFVRRFTF